MKKLVLTIVLVSAIGFANAQDMMSKKGTPILPEKDDWSIGFDANFLLGYLGNIFHGNNATNSPLAAYQVGNSIVGKMMKDENTAYVGILRIGNVSVKTTTPINDQTSTATPAAKVNDEKTNSRMNINLAAGIQKYRGKGRLKGVYGAGLGITLGSNKDSYTYGNALDATHPNVTNSTSFGANAGVDGADNINAGANTRATEVKTGSVFGVGARGWVGVEYFFAPKLSLGAQYGWAIAILSAGQGSRTEEGFDATSQTVKSNTVNTSKTSTFYIDVDNLSGQIILAAYF